MPEDSDLIEIAKIRQSDAPNWGHKASMLGELLGRGFPVPDGFCLSIPTFRKVGAEFNISPRIETALRSASESLLLSNKFLAVRSSAAAEDLPDVSFAGLYKSVIGISEPEEVGTAVQTVWRSYTDPSAVAARMENQQDNSSGGMGVLIQPVIHAEVAGVCFSIDPVQTQSGRVVINASWGLGIGVVDGSITADTIWLKRDDLAVVEKRVAKKDAHYTLDPLKGLVRNPVPEPHQKTECLPDVWARCVAQFAMAVEQVFDQPQDVEWVIAAGKLWIIQSRPIASLNGHEAVSRHLFPVRWENPEDARRFWRRTRFEFNGNLPFLPLEIDYKRICESTRLATCLFMGEDRNEDMLVVNGHVYSSQASLPLSEADLHVRKQAMQDLELRLVRQGLTAWDYWGPEIELANERLVARDISHLDGPDLADFLEQAMATHNRHFMLHPMIWFKPRQSYLDAFQAISGLSGPEAETAAYRLLEGEESPLTRLIGELYKLAEKARNLPAVADWMRRVVKNPTNQPKPELAGFPKKAPGAESWIKLFQDFLSEFGDRNGSGYGSEALITTPTWRDHPLQVVQLAAQFLDEKAVSPSIRRRQSRQAVDAQVDALCRQCHDQQIVEDFLHQLEIARRAQSVVEIHNHHIDQVGLGQLRRGVLAASDWLQSAGILTKGDQIFWLTFSEILAALRKPTQKPLADIIKTRQEEYQGWEQYEPPPFLGLPSALLPPFSSEDDAQIKNIPQNPGHIYGIGASAGVVSGRARVIKTWQPALQFKTGDILVTENAGPLWLPHFPILSGIVLEGGSLGQHAASTAREYGLPAVISALNATQKIEDGEWITIDGEKGIVILEEELQ